ncbi:hypothetical protein TNCV_2132241 [Trichonephila clavipes]|nr:hypothetical protein TNCV_2132241 [Trichonephila clavipes]
MATLFLPTQEVKRKGKMQIRKLLNIRSLEFKLIKSASFIPTPHADDPGEGERPCNGKSKEAGQNYPITAQSAGFVL